MDELKGSRQAGIRPAIIMAFPSLYNARWNFRGVFSLVVFGGETRVVLAGLLGVTLGKQEGWQDQRQCPLSKTVRPSLALLLTKRERTHPRPKPVDPIHSTFDQARISSLTPEHHHEERSTTSNLPSSPQNPTRVNRSPVSHSLISRLEHNQSIHTSIT